jgi:hypothetical protein
MKRMFMALLAGLIFVIANSATVLAKNPYYGFYPSTKGKDFKLLKHNILGFSIDIPSTWTFGVL